MKTKTTYEVLNVMYVFEKHTNYIEFYFVPNEYTFVIKPLKISLN